MEEAFVESPIGTLQLEANEQGICRIHFCETPKSSTRKPDLTNPHLLCLSEELDRYFSGDLECFTVSVCPTGTEFQRKVWQRVATIPFRVTKTYGKIAAEIEKKSAARAVGGAVNRNPTPIIIPCHRVVGSGNSLVGFAGGVWRKQWLLEHEGMALPLGKI